MGKKLYILAGCNGAGKTTASLTILPEIWMCKEFVNADQIAVGLSPFNPQSVEIAAGRLMLQRIHTLLEQGETFSIETTLSTRSYVELIKKAHSMGYKVELLFFWLNNVDLAKHRVAQRVKEGGHDIPEDIIERRYIRGIYNFKHLYKDIVDSWMIIDNSQNPRQIIATQSNVIQKDSYNQIITYVG